MLPTLCSGIHQSGVILQSALQAAFADLRAKPHLLRYYCFASLGQDMLLSKELGGAEIEKAVSWFLNNDIKVLLPNRTTSVTFPSVTLKVLSSNEAENTLGDINVDPLEDADFADPNLVGPFDAVSYAPVTGYLTIPDPSPFVTAVGQSVVTKTGHRYSVATLPPGAPVTVPPTQLLGIDKALTEDFSGMVIRGVKPGYVTSLESAEFSETYMLGCHAQGESIYATYLHSIVVFALLSYREALLESRNFERSSINSTAEGEKEQLTKQELVYSRYLQISGYVRNMWPKNISPKITGVVVQPKIVGGGVLAPGQESTAPWLGDLDHNPFM